MIKQLAADFFAGPQLVPEHMPLIAEKGIKVVINNRPDGEQPGQPTTHDMRAAAEAAGITYYALPVTGQTIDADAVKKTKEILDKNEGPTLAHCASGNRSSILWALVQVCEEGQDIDEVCAHLQECGIDPSNARPLMEMISANYEQTD